MSRMLAWGERARTAIALVRIVSWLRLASLRIVSEGIDPAHRRVA